MTVEMTMTRVQARPTFGATITRQGLTRAELAAEAGISPRTLDALATPPRGREGYTRAVTAWKIARGFARKAGIIPDEAFTLLFIEVEAEE